MRLGYPRWIAILDVLNLAYNSSTVFLIAFPLFLAVAPLLFPRRFREESEFLLAFLKQTLEAEEVPPHYLAT